jgi:hypothetical protein
MLLGGCVLVSGIGYHLLALADEDQSYTTALRGISLVADIGLSIGAVVALMLVLLPRIVFQWPRSTPGSLAAAALVVVAIAAVTVGMIGLIALAGAVSEIGVENSEREFASSTSEVWAEIFLGLGAAGTSALAAVYAILGIGTVHSSRDRQFVQPDLAPPSPLIT